MLIISLAVVSELSFLSNLSLMWSIPLVVMLCLQLENELPLLGFLSLCSLEVALNELKTFLVEGGTRLEAAIFRLTSNTFFVWSELTFFKACRTRQNGRNASKY